MFSGFDLTSCDIAKCYPFRLEFLRCTGMRYGGKLCFKPREKDEEVEWGEFPMQVSHEACTDCNLKESNMDDYKCDGITIFPDCKYEMSLDGGFQNNFHPCCLKLIKDRPGHMSPYPVGRCFLGTCIPRYLALSHA